MMLLKAILLLPIALVAAQSSCQDVHLFLARGNGESYPGRIGDIVNTICPGLSSCDYEDIMYTSVAGYPYCNSIFDGASNGIAQITAYNKRCPNSKLILGGYSEGGHIVGDILGGGSGGFYDCYENYVAGLNPYTAPGNMIVAALIFGDTRHVAGQSYNVGTGSGMPGEYPRSGTDLANLNAFASRIQNYCLITDPICALGFDGESHTTYMTVFAAAAGQWAIQQVNLGGAISNHAATSSAAPPPPSSSSVVLPPTSSTPLPVETSSSSSELPLTTSSSELPLTTSSSSLIITTTSSSSALETSSSISSSTVKTPFVFSDSSVVVTAATSASVPTNLRSPTTTSATPTSSNGAARPTGFCMGMAGIVAIGALALQ